MADYDLEAKITADASGYEAGVKKAEKASKKLSTSVSKVIQGLGKNGLVGALGAVGLASQGLTSTLGAVVKIARKVSETMNECTNAYKNQLIAERALDTAIKNNPFVTGSSAKALKEYASEMQKVTNYGDEELIPMMANLVSLGRTENETMQIMSVAMDMSAGMGISLDSAITQLNATLNGNIGRLGQQNKELKNLTEEELKSGKAVEILGKKFKGLASATVDTSKQLQNIKGDFKEAIGQFTLPSSDMWNKFWAGFYQSGIDVINRFNDYLDTQIIGKKILENLNSNARAVANATGNTVEDVLSDMRYLKEQISYLSDSEIITLQKTLEQQKKRTTAEERMLTIVKEIEHSRKLQLEQDKKDAEAEAKRVQALTEQEELENGIAELKQKHTEAIKAQEAQWKNIEKVTGKEVSLEEKMKFYQDDLVKIMTEAGGQITTNNEYYKQQMAIINNIKSQLGEIVVDSEWGKKLLEQRISLLEEEKEKAVANAEELGIDVYDVEKYYNDKLLELRLQRLAKEKEEALEDKNLTEEDKLKIEQYYNNEIKKIYEEAKDFKGKKGKEETKDVKEKLKAMLAMVQQYARNIKQAFSKVADVIKDVFSAIKNGFSNALKIFQFNPDEALDNLLKIEDSILTFFVETLPQLPKFFASAIESIIKLLGSLIQNIDWKKVEEIITGLIDMFIENAPTMIRGILDVLMNVAQSVLDGIIYFFESGGFKTLLDLLLEIQKKIETFVTDNIDEIVQTIVDALPDLIQFLVESIVSASKTFQKLIRPIIKLVLAIIEAILELMSNEDVINTAIDTLIDLGDAIMEDFIPALIKLIVKAIPKVVNAVIKNLPKIVQAFIKGLVNSFTTIDWWDIIKQCFMGFIESFKNLFGIHSPSTLFEEFGGYIIQGFWNGIKNLGSWLWENVSAFFTDLWEKITGIFSNIGDWFSNTFGGAGENISNAFNGIGNWASDRWSDIKDGFGNVGDWFKTTFSNAWSNVQSAFSNAGSWFGGVWSNIKSGFSNVGSWFKTTFSNAWSGIKSAWSNVSSWFGNIASSIQNNFANCVSNMKSAFQSAGNWIKDMAGNIGSGLSKAGETIRDGASWVGNKIKDFFGFANGTQQAPKGLALVGEAGPELVKFNGGEQVLNTHNTQKALEGVGGKSNTFNVTFNNLQDTSAFAMIQQLRQYNRQMAINGVI